jgi:hypothetical protein
MQEGSAMKFSTFFELLLRPLKDDFLRLPQVKQDELLSKYRLPRIEFTLACELEELQLIAADIDQAINAHRLAPLIEPMSTNEKEKRTVPFVQRLKRLVYGYGKRPPLDRAASFRALRTKNFIRS